MATPPKRTPSGRPKSGSAGAKPTARTKPAARAKPTAAGNTQPSSGAKPAARAKPTRASDAASERSSKPRAKKKSSRAKPVHDHAPSPREERDGVRLQKFLASAGVASRRHAEDLIVAGHVAVNGELVRELGTRVVPERDRVTVRGEPVKAEAKAYYVLNKPDAIVCSAQGSVDERGRPTVLSLMHGIRERLYPVGRLDFHSRGVVLLTNDGELAEALTHPRHGVVKTYHVKFQGKLTDEDEQALRDGVELDDGAITRPLAELFAFRETGSNVWYQLGLTEGLNRQIRRMGDAIGHPVLKLIRVAIGDITADGLEEGQHRPLKPTEVAQLLAAVRLAPERARKPKPPAAKAPARPAQRASASSSATGSASRKPAARPGPAKPKPSARPSKPRPAKK